eukprot:10630567-Alexandrium_andersonii.AAC.1
MHDTQEKLTAINGAMDSILAMENEFEIFVQTNLTDIWHHTLRVEYGPTARDRAEADFDLVNQDFILQDENMAAG